MSRLVRIFWVLIEKLKRKRNWIPALIVIVLILIWAGYQVGWTNFRTQYLWDWLELLIIPIVLGAGALLFQKAERITEREINFDKQRQDILMTYLDRIENLLLQNELHKSKENSEVRTVVARARTLSVLQNLDGLRKHYALQFLYESGLIRGKNPVVDLEGAHLEGANLQGSCIP